MHTDPITTSSFSSAQILQLWSNTKRRFERSRSRIGYSQSVQTGGEGVLRPDLSTGADAADFDPHADPLTMSLPGRWEIPLGVINRFAEDIPVIERRPIGSTPTARRDAELLGTWLNTAVTETMDVEECYAKSVEDAEYAVVVVPSTAHFEQSPDFMDTISEGEYAALDPKDQKSFEPGDSKGTMVRVNSAGRRVPSPQWTRDSAGRAADHANYSGKRDAGASKKAYDEAHQAYLASKPPWLVRIVSAMDCAPILVRGRGRKRYECKGLIIRTLYDVEELLEQEYLWPGADNRQLIPLDYRADNTYGANGQLYLYEAFLTVGGHPIVAYSVGGRPTRKGDQVDAIVDLYQEYGLERLMVHYAYGLHNGSDNPDQRGIPMLYPLAKTLVGAESLITATNVHSWKDTFSGHYLPIPPGAPVESYLEQNGQLRKFSVPTSGEVLPVPGIPVPAAPAEISQTARYLVQMLLGQVQSNEPDQAQEGQNSGHGLTVANDLERAAQRQIPEGVREAVEFVAESILEICCAIKAKHGVAVPLWINEEIEPAADVAGEAQTRWRILELQDRWIGGVYKVTAVFPKRGNLAEVSLLSDLVAKGHASMDDLMEARGKENPQAEKAKIDAERILTGTPEGQMAALANALRWRGETEKAAQLELQLSQRLSQFGVPTAAMQGPPPQGQTPPQPGGGGMPGAHPVDVAAAVRGGIVAGQMGTASRINDARAQMGIAPNGVA